ncbi:MAG: hypothetical protein HY720_13535 [Planctomycetes bacterium]|nr:hypothetical protein [Planctomycetota bacterium]
MTALEPEPEKIGEIAVRNKVLTTRQLEDCKKLRETLRESHGLDYTLGQVILERVYASNPKARPMLLRVGGVEEILGPDARVDFWKFTRSGHDRFVDRIKREGLVLTETYVECSLLREELRRLGILRRVGEILVDRGSVPRELAEEHRRFHIDPEELPALAFTRIAVQNGLVSEREAADALELADQIEEDLGLHLPIGQIFYETGLLARGEVEAILAAQVQVGRLPRGSARLKALDLSDIEEDALLARLNDRGAVAPEDLDRAAGLAMRLAEFGVQIEALEVLWLEGKVPEEAIADMLAYQAAHQARHEPEPPRISLSFAPSADALVRQRPPDVQEIDFLFGQFAIVAGALSRGELEGCLSALRIARKELGLSSTLSEILFDRYRDDPYRLRLLRSAQREICQFLGFPYEVKSLHLSPLENEVAARMLASEVCALITREIDKARWAVLVLADVAVRRTVPEILLQRGLLSGPKWEAFLKELGARGIPRSRRDQKATPEPHAASLFERAFSTDVASPGWGKSQLGDLAVEKGLVKPPELVRALYVQLRAREIGVLKPFGEILIELGYLDPPKLAGLLKLQQERLAEIRDETAVPSEPLAMLDEILIQRVRATGVLDDERLREVLRVRGQLRALGLRGSLREVLIRRGELDSEIVEAIFAEARKEEKTKRIQEAALLRAGAGKITTAFAIEQAVMDEMHRTESAPEPTRPIADRVLLSRRRSGGRVRRIAAAAGITVTALGLLLAAQDASGGRSPRVREGPTTMRPEEPRGTEEAPADAAAFEAAMRERGMVLRGGRWVPAADVDSTDTRPSPRTPDERRARFAARMEEEGYRKVPGGWLHPEALRKLAEIEERSAAGKVWIGGKWRPVESAVRSPAPAGAEDGLEEVSRPSALSELEAVLVEEEERTRIALRFRSALPPTAILVLTLARESRPNSVFYSGQLAPGRTGLVELEAEPMPRRVRPGRYLIGLAYKPEFQSGLAAALAPYPVACAVDLVVGSENEIAARRRASRDAMLQAARRLETLAGTVAVGTEPSRLPAMAAGCLPEAEAIRSALVREDGAGEADGGGANAEARDALARAARILCDCLARLAAGGELDRAALDDFRACIARCRECLRE